MNKLFVAAVFAAVLPAAGLAQDALPNEDFDSLPAQEIAKPALQETEEKEISRPEELGASSEIQRELEKIRAAMELENLRRQRLELELAQAKNFALEQHLEAAKQPRKKRAFLMNNRVLFVSGGHNGGILAGTELGFGNVRPDDLVIQGIINFAVNSYDYVYYDNYYSRYYSNDGLDVGWGGGVFTGPAFDVHENVKIIPGITAGFWIYLIEDWDYIDLHWGGVELRFMFGREFFHLDVFGRALLGTRVADSYYDDNGGKSGFVVKATWGVGLSLLGNRKR